MKCEKHPVKLLVSIGLTFQRQLWLDNWKTVAGENADFSFRI